jgi:hypothetical protein
MFQMQIYITVVLLLYSGAVSGGLEKVLRLAEFIADIYRQFPHSCVFIINPAAQQQGEDWFCIVCSGCVFVVNRNVLTDRWDCVYVCNGCVFVVNRNVLRDN